MEYSDDLKIEFDNNRNIGSLLFSITDAAAAAKCRFHIYSFLQGCYQSTAFVF